jgi:hypothetical protein
MEQIPSWEANQFSASQKIPLILWIPMVQYGVYNSLPRVPILGQIKPLRAPIPLPEESS